LIAHEAAVIDGGLQLTSSAIPGFGVRTVRDIRLAPTGTQATLVSRVERLGTGATFRLAPWTAN